MSNDGGNDLYFTLSSIRNERREGKTLIGAGKMGSKTLQLTHYNF